MKLKHDFLWAIGDVIIIHNLIWKLLIFDFSCGRRPHFSRKVGVFLNFSRILLLLWVKHYILLIILITNFFNFKLFHRFFLLRYFQFCRRPWICLLLWTHFVVKINFNCLFDGLFYFDWFLPWISPWFWSCLALFSFWVRSLLLVAGCWPQRFQLLKNRQRLLILPFFGYEILINAGLNVILLKIKVFVWLPTFFRI